jgi:hypothetical protein
MKNLFLFILFLPLLLFGQNNYSLYFDGGDYLYKSIANYRSGDAKGAISFWAKSNNLNNHQSVLSSGDEASATRYVWVWMVDGGEFAFENRNNDVKDSFNSDDEVFSTSVWKHFIISSNSDTTRLYVNNIEQATTVSSGVNDGDWFSDTANRDNLCIGALYRNSIALQGKMYIDEFSIFSDSLTDQQRDQLYNGGFPTDVSGMDNLVDYWQFEEGEGVTTAATTGSITFQFGDGSTPTTYPTWSADTPGWGPRYDTTNYYIDPTSGADTCMGHSMTTALASFDSINTAGRTLEKGDSLCMRTDNMLRQQLTMPQDSIWFTSYDSASTILYGTNCTGAKPIISGADLVATWTAVPVSDDWTNTQPFTFDFDDAGSAWFRDVIPALSVGGNGTEIRIQVEAHSASNTVFRGTSIGSKGVGPDYASTPTRITWSGGQSDTTIAAGTTAYSDWIEYTWTDADSHLIHFDSPAPTDFRRVDVGGISAYYEIGGADQTMVLDVTAGGNTSWSYLVIKIEVRSGANTWQASLATEPKLVHFNNVNGVNDLTPESALDWCYSGGVLYCYAASDPDELYTSPGIEASVRAVNVAVTGKDYITFDNLYITKGNHASNSAALRITDGSDNVKVQNCTISSNGTNGIQIFASSAVHTKYAHITTNTISNNGLASPTAGDGCGIITYSFDRTHLCDSTIIELNTISNNGAIDYGDHNIYDMGNQTIIRRNSISGAKGFGIKVNTRDSINTKNKIYTNLIYNNDNGGVRLEDDTGAPDGVKIWNNTFVNNNTLSPYCHFNYIYKSSASAGKRPRGNEFKNNILVENNNSTAYGLYFGLAGYATADLDSAAMGLDTDYNDIYMTAAGSQYASRHAIANYGTFAAYIAAMTSSDQNSISSDPLFADAANEDFTLSPASPCRDTGIGVGLTLDFYGNNVSFGPGIDIGSHEFQRLYKQPLQRLLRLRQLQASTSFRSGTGGAGGGEDVGGGEEGYGVYGTSVYGTGVYE